MHKLKAPGSLGAGILGGRDPWGPGSLGTMSFATASAHPCSIAFGACSQSNNRAAVVRGALESDGRRFSEQAVILDRKASQLPEPAACSYIGHGIVLRRAE